MLQQNACPAYQKADPVVSAVSDIDQFDLAYKENFWTMVVTGWPGVGNIKKCAGPNGGCVLY